VEKNIVASQHLCLLDAGWLENQLSLKVWGFLRRLFWIANSKDGMTPRMRNYYSRVCQGVQ
jgi:hypothetical protein